MKIETMEQAIQKLHEYQHTMAAYGHAMGVLYLDATTAAPSDSWEGRGKTMEILSKITYELQTSPDVGQMLELLEQNVDVLTAVQKRQVEVIRKGYDQTFRIPAEEYVAYSVLTNDAGAVWEKAKNKNDMNTGMEKRLRNLL